MQEKETTPKVSKLSILLKRLKQFYLFLRKKFVWIPLASIAALRTTYLSFHDTFKTDHSYEIMKMVAQVKHESIYLSLEELPESLKQEPNIKQIRSLQKKILSARDIMSSINVQPAKTNNLEIDAINCNSELKKIKRLNDLNLEINDDLSIIVALYPQHSNYFNLKEYKKRSCKANKAIAELLDDADDFFMGNLSDKDKVILADNILCDKKLLTYLNSKDNELLLIFGFLNVLQIDIKRNNM